MNDMNLWQSEYEKARAMTNDTSLYRGWLRRQKLRGLADRVKRARKKLPRQCVGLFAVGAVASELADLCKWAPGEIIMVSFEAVQEK
jgi:hypothetical protein